MYNTYFSPSCFKFKNLIGIPCRQVHPKIPESSFLTDLLLLLDCSAILKLLSHFVIYFKHILNFIKNIDSSFELQHGALI